MSDNHEAMQNFGFSTPESLIPRLLIRFAAGVRAFTFYIQTQSARKPRGRFAERSGSISTFTML